MTNIQLNRSPLHDFHLERGAKMAPFAGYEMPVHYDAGILKEHVHTRVAAGLFDVSHMGQIIVRPRLGRMEDVARSLEQLMPADLIGLKEGRQRYTQFTTESGGIQDDLMIALFPSFFLLVVNAAQKELDEACLKEHSGEILDIEVLSDHALLALQGPGSEAVLGALAPTTSGMKFMDAGHHKVMGVDCLVSRSGYTGEDGFEISMPAGKARAIVDRLLEFEEVSPIGLGARDTLRLEAGLCLYGKDIDLTTSPVAAGLEWSIPKCRRSEGVRGGGFPGAATILAQMQTEVTRRLVGLRPDSRPIRGGARIYEEESSGEPIGIVTSGGFGPSLNAPVAIGYVSGSHAATGTRLFGECRNGRHPMTVTSLPFVSHRYKRL